MDGRIVQNEADDDGFYDQFKPIQATVSQVDVALKCRLAGVSVLPTKTDGSKAPKDKEWKTLMSALPTQEYIQSNFSQPCGIGAINGAVSGNMETIDFESTEAYEEWAEVVSDIQPSLISKLVVSSTPGGKFKSEGRHVRYRVDGTALPCKKLAHTDKEELLIELKGEGGYAILPGSHPKTHLSGKEYRYLQGDIDALSVITTDERDLLISVATGLNRFVKPEREYSRQSSADLSGERPGDSYNATEGFSVLYRHRWEQAWSRSGVTYLRRPGKKTPGISASLGHCRGRDGTPRLYVFSTDASPLEANRTYDAFGVYAALEHEGDFRAAARSLCSHHTDCSPRATTSGEQTQEIIGDPRPNEWEKPTPLDSLPASVKFPIEVCPPILADIASEVAESIRGPLDFAGTTAIMTTATLIGSTRELLIKKSTGWYASPRGYAALVGRSGGVKSPILRFFKKPLEDHQDALANIYQTKKDEYDLEKEAWEVAKKQATDSSKTKPPPQPVYGRILTDNFTVESLCPILRDNPRGVGAFKDELTSLFMSLNQYKGGKGDDRQFFLSVHGGENVTIDRKSFGGIPIVVKRPFLVICGGLPPSFLSEMQDTKNRQDGMLERFFYAYPDDPPIEGWNEEGVRDTARINWEGLCQKLLRYSHRAVQGGLMPELVNFSRDGKIAWDEEFERNVEEMRHPDFCQDSFRAYWEKANGYAGNLALILESIRSVDSIDQAYREVTVASVRAAWKLMDYFKNSFRRVSSHLNTSSEVAKAQKVLAWIKRHKPRAFQRGDVHNHLKHSNMFAKIESLDEPLTRLIAHGYV